MNLKIRQTTMSPYSTRVWLDGYELTSGLTGLDLSMACDDATTATLRILVDGVDIDAETLALLEAHIKLAEPAV